ncbi:histidine kinase [Dethiobacter alkaliphilus]|nr:histidine kinase [Dethiobacter alkaliphilus]MCW3490593.1 histidine kinase [Dethiobacter alkaliphilus]
MSKEELAELKERIEDLKKRMPKHSVKPAMLQELEELEERLAELERD